MFCIARFEVYLCLECASYSACVHWWNLKNCNCWTIMLASRMPVSVIPMRGCRGLVFFCGTGAVLIFVNRNYSGLPLILFYPVRKFMHCKCHMIY
jgi:hypothetical protein